MGTGGKNKSNVVGLMVLLVINMGLIEHGFATCGTTKETLTSGFKVNGEIEDCNVIMDRDFGKAKGFGRFMRPFKMFEGCKLHCQKATDGKNKGVVSTVNAAPLVQQATPQMMARNAHILALDPTHESSQGVRYDRYIDLARHTFGQKLRPWIVLPQQLIVQVGVNIVYAYKKTSGADKAGVVQKKKGQTMCSLPRPVYIQEKKALNPLEAIGSFGVRNFMLCEKPQVVEEVGNAKPVTVGITRKNSGSWKSWFNKSLNMKVSSH
ncbi:hypothetical protein CTI12_AA363960 [Artemisia annua]|uniref:Uncharacterized protein n=1 Tax=Artemisia annua TaxID=35608 RepID=A0A2U1MM19_ARTAN|nr:hypothetical protein CTI12_AA363960 [Artemisia annua]